MKSPTKTQRTAAAKAMLKAHMDAKFDSRPAHRGYVAGLLPEEIVLIDRSMLFIGELPDNIPPSPDPENFMDWRAFLKGIHRDCYTQYELFTMEDVQRRLDFTKERDHQDGRRYPANSAVIRYPLPDGKEIGFVCERLIRACKLVGTMWPQNEPLLWLPARSIDPAILEGDYGKVYLLPVRL